ncbi:MAG: pinensin family lanthipeptide [Cyclobacteriaceae bacterium]
MKKKLNIEKLKVESFVTGVKAEDKVIVKGGSAFCVSFLVATQCACRHH